MTKTSPQRCYRICLKDTIHLAIKILAIIIILGLAFMFGRLSSPYKTLHDALSIESTAPTVTQEQAESVVEEKEATPEVISATDFFVTPLFTLTDVTIKAVSKNELTISFIDSEPNADGKKETQKTLIVPSNLLVEVRIEKKSSDLNSEIEKLKNEGIESDDSIKPYTIEQKDLNYLKKGDIVTITTKENIRSNDKATATSIILYELAVPEMVTEKKETKQ